MSTIPHNLHEYTKSHEEERNMHINQTIIMCIQYKNLTPTIKLNMKQFDSLVYTYIHTCKYIPKYTYLTYLNQRKYKILMLNIKNSKPKEMVAGFTNP